MKSILLNFIKNVFELGPGKDPEKNFRTQIQDFQNIDRREPNLFIFNRMRSQF